MPHQVTDVIRVTFDELESGMTLAAPLRHPAKPDHVLLHADYRIDPETIHRLRRFDIRYLWIRHPGFEFLNERIGQAVPDSRARLYESVKRSFTGIAGRTVGAFNLTEYRTVVSNAIMAIIADKANAVHAERLIEGGGELFAHSANVAYLALVVGMRVKDYVVDQRKHTSRVDAEDLTNLGVGALLHDLGKLGLPEELHEVHACDPQADGREYREHPLKGYNAVRGRVESTAAAVVLHHHQRYDGGGFPELPPPPGKQSATPMEGDSIHVFARITAVANVLDGLMARCQQRNLPAIAALDALRKDQWKAQFDPVVLDATLRSIPPFPLGTRVKLSDGQGAVVTDLNDGAPCRPKVHVVKASDRRLGDVYDEIDLNQSGAPDITEFEDKPVKPYLYTLPPRRPDRSGRMGPDETD